MSNINFIIKARHLDFTVQTSNCKGLTGAVLDPNTSLLFHEPQTFTFPPFSDAWAIQKIPVTPVCCAIEDDRGAEAVCEAEFALLLVEKIPNSAWH